MSNSSPQEGFISHEPQFTQAEVEAVREAMGPFIQATKPLIEAVQQSPNSSLRSANSGWQIEPREPVSGPREQDMTVFDAGFYPDAFAGRLLRGANGETLRIHMYYDPNDGYDVPSDVTVQGQSKEGAFNLGYHRDFKGAGVSCVMPTGNYRAGFNLTNDDIGVKVVPQPLGQVKLGWSAQEGTVQVVSPGVLLSSKERFEILPAGSYDPRDRNVLDYDDAMDWYSNTRRLRGADRRKAELEAWLVGLSTVKFQNLVDQAKTQAEQALEAVQSVIADPTTATVVTPAEYEAMQRQKFSD
jgi:hypothetical protein